MTRDERIVVLVWSLGDAIALPASGRGEVRRPAPTALVECEACQGSGRGADRFGRATACSSCAGRGRFWVDGYTGERTGAPGDPGPGPELVSFWRRVGCSWCQDGDRGHWDAQAGTWVSHGRRFEALPRGSGVRCGERCEDCDGSGWVRVPAEMEVPSVERSRDVGGSVAWRIKGSYGELARALDDLRAWSPRCYRAFVSDATAGVWPIEPLSAYELGASRLGLVRVMSRMPAKIKVAGDVLAAWRDRERRSEMIRGPKRDARIRELVAAGVAPAVVARRAGISERQVRRIAYPAA